MRNFKKLLSLVLCMAVMLSVMVVGAGAAFSDQSKIKNSDAVDACVALDIINGYNDGSYKPEGTITRAEMCKMICVALNGGKDPVLGTSATASFTDTKGHWAEGYIESCVSQGIVAGIGGGKFNPNGNVTGSQAAKMLLIALGFKSDVEKFTGDAWEVNVNVRATQKDLYDGLESMDVSAALTRDNAAQMIWNTLQAYMVSYKNEFSTVNGQLVATQVLADKTGANGVRITLLKDKYNADIYEGVLHGSGDYADAGYTAGKDKMAMDATVLNGIEIAPSSETFKYTEDVTGLLGQYVKVLVNNKGEAYGVFAVADENTVVTAAFSDVKLVSASTSTADGKIKIDGTEYKFTNALGTSVINGISTTTVNNIATSAYNSADVITFVSNDGDSKFDYAIINPILSVSKVTYVSKESFTTNGTEVKYEDVIAPSDLAKDDYVVKTIDLFTGDAKYVKADTVKGKITSSKGTVGSLTDICVDGTWYQVGEGTTAAFNGMVKYTNDSNTLALKSTYTLQVVDGVVYYSKLESAGSTDTALVLGASSAMDTNGNMQVKLLFADGTIKVVPAKANYTANIIPEATGSDRSAAFVTYEIKDGVYELTKIDNSNKLNKDSYVSANAGFDKSAKKVNGVRVADSAVIYVQYKDGSDYKTKVMTGKELNGLGSNFGAKSYYVVDGTTICAALIAADGYLPGASAGKLYGYVTSDITTNNEDGTDYKSFTVWTSNNESIDVKMKGNTAINKEDLISFEMGENGFIEGVNTESAGTLSTVTAAIKGFGDKYAIFYKDGTTGADDKDFDDDVKFLYLNTKDVKGVSGGELAKADQTNNANEYFANCKYVLEGTDIVLIAIDTNLNKWDGAADIVNH